MVKCCASLEFRWYCAQRTSKVDAIFFIKTCIPIQRCSLPTNSVHDRLPHWASYHCFMIYKQRTSYLSRQVLGSLYNDWRTEQSHGKTFQPIVGVMFGWIDIKMFVNIHMSRLHVCAMETMAFWEWVPYYLLWQKWSNVSNGTCWREGHATRTTQTWKPELKNKFRRKTVGLLLRLTKPIWGTSWLVILDSGFCVLDGIIALWNEDIFASALIKKRKHWPCYIPSDG